MKKIISIFLVIVFLSNSFGISSSANFLPKSMIPSRAILDSGAIVESYQGSSLTKIICIKDLHANPQVQKNIAKIIADLRGKYGDSLKLVGVEGSYGRIDTRIISSIPDEGIKQKVISHFLEQGRLGGAELYSIRNPGNIDIVGIEDKNEYLENFKSLYTLKLYKPKLDTIFKQLKKNIYIAKKYLYPKDMKTLEKKERLYKQNRITFRRYLRYITDLSRKYDLEHALRDYPTLKIYVERINGYGSVSLAKLLSEYASLLLRLKKKILADTEYGLNLMLYDYYLDLFSRYLDAGVTRRESELWLLGREKLYELGDVFSTKLNRYDYLENIKDFLQETDKMMQRFYKLASKRNETLVTNSLKFIARKSKAKKPKSQALDTNVGIIIVGGYHIQGITNILKARGISYDIILPNMRGKYDNTIYLKRINEQAKEMGLDTFAISEAVSSGARNNHTLNLVSDYSPGQDLRRHLSKVFEYMIGEFGIKDLKDPSKERIDSIQDFLNGYIANSGNNINIEIDPKENRKDVICLNTKIGDREYTHSIIEDPNSMGGLVISDRIKRFKTIEIKKDADNKIRAIAVGLLDIFLNEKDPIILSKVDNNKKFSETLYEIIKNETGINIDYEKISNKFFQSYVVARGYDKSLDLLINVLKEVYSDVKNNPIDFINNGFNNIPINISDSDKSLKKQQTTPGIYLSKHPDGSGYDCLQYEEDRYLIYSYIYDFMRLLEPDSEKRDHIILKVKNDKRDDIINVSGIGSKRRKKNKKFKRLSISADNENKLKAISVGLLDKIILNKVDLPKDFIDILYKRFGFADNINDEFFKRYIMAKGYSKALSLVFELLQEYSILQEYSKDIDFKILAENFKLKIYVIHDDGNCDEHGKNRRCEVFLYAANDNKYDYLRQIQEKCYFDIALPGYWEAYDLIFELKKAYYKQQLEKKSKKIRLLRKKLKKYESQLSKYKKDRKEINKEIKLLTSKIEGPKPKKGARRIKTKPQPKDINLKEPCVRQRKELEDKISKQINKFKNKQNKQKQLKKYLEKLKKIKNTKWPKKYKNVYKEFKKRQKQFRNIKADVCKIIGSDIRIMDRTGIAESKHSRSKEDLEKSLKQKELEKKSLTTKIRLLEKEILSLNAKIKSLDEPERIKRFKIEKEQEIPAKPHIFYIPPVFEQEIKKLFTGTHVLPVEIREILKTPRKNRNGLSTDLDKDPIYYTDLLEITDGRFSEKKREKNLVESDIDRCVRKIKFKKQNSSEMAKKNASELMKKTAELHWFKNREKELGRSISLRVTQRVRNRNDIKKLEKKLKHKGKKIKKNNEIENIRKSLKILRKKRDEINRILGKLKRELRSVENSITTVSHEINTLEERKSESEINEQEEIQRLELKQKGLIQNKGILERAIRDITKFKRYLKNKIAVLKHKTRELTLLERAATRNIYDPRFLDELSRGVEQLSKPVNTVMGDENRLMKSRKKKEKRRNKGGLKGGGITVFKRRRRRQTKNPIFSDENPLNIENLMSLEEFAIKITDEFLENSNIPKYLRIEIHEPLTRSV